MGRGEEPPPLTLPGERVVPSLKRLIRGLGPNPAYILGRRWDYLAWNRATTALFGDLNAVAPSARNHVWLTFMDPARRQMFTDWEESYPRLVAKFRADHARYLGDPDFEQLIERLRRCSPEFCEAWKRHEVDRGGGGRKELRHPEVGRLSFEHAVFHPTEAPEQRLILYSPLPDHDTAAKVARLLAERSASTLWPPAHERGRARDVGLWDRLEPAGDGTHERHDDVAGGLVLARAVRDEGADEVVDDAGQHAAGVEQLQDEGLDVRRGLCELGLHVRCSAGAGVLALSVLHARAVAEEAHERARVAAQGDEAGRGSRRRWRRPRSRSM